jgi:hypothetical protein
MWSIQLAFLLFIVGMMIISSLTYGTVLHFSHSRSEWSPSFSSTTLQNLPGISDLLFEVSTFSAIRSYAQNVALDWFLPYN